jgi:hypothetical protein
MSFLAQFLLRLAFGLAVGMSITSSNKVSSGFFRNHLYVTLGLATLAGLASAVSSVTVCLFAIFSAVTSYLGIVSWLYERPVGGKISLLLVALFSFLATSALSLDHTWDYNAIRPVRTISPTPQGELTDDEKIAQMDRNKEALIWLEVRFAILRFTSNISSALLVGFTTTAMLLGHWYLNSPGMELAPLRRLISAAGWAVLLQVLVSLISLFWMFQTAAPLPLYWILLRWSFGIVGVGATLWMAWQTLKIPNTQSATGILYVSVIGAFIGELAASLLSAESAFPL